VRYHPAMLALLALAFAEEPAPAPPTAPAPDAEPAPPAEDLPLIPWPDVKVKLRPRTSLADLPKELRGAGEQRCLVRVVVDETGQPTEATPAADRCPAALRELGRTVALRYRFYPLKEDGVVTAGQVDVPIAFPQRGR
jgi:hypothetical protein